MISKKKIVTFSVLVLGIALTILSNQCTYAQERRAVNLSNASGLPFSDGVVAGNTLYIAGQEGSDDSGKLVGGGIATETRQLSKTFRK